MREHLKTAGLINLIGANLVKEEVDDNQAQLAKSMIISTLAPSEIEKIIHCETAAAIWKHLESGYSANTSNVKLELMQELNQLCCNSANEVESAINKVLVIKGRLENLGVNIDDSMVISALMNSLPAGLYEVFLESWGMLELELQTLERFVRKLSEKTKSLISAGNDTALLAENVNRGGHYGRGGRGGYGGRGGRGGRGGYRGPNLPYPGRPSNSNQSQKNSLAYQNNQQQLFYQQKTCYYCHKVGHLKDECRKLKYALEQKLRAQESQTTANVAVEIEEEVEIAFIATTSPTSDDTEWIVDSGCSSHMTPRREWLDDYREFDQPVNIRIGDNSLLPALGSGNIKTKYGKMVNVYYVPKLGSNLFSISAATDRKTEYRINQDGIDLFVNGRFIMRAVRDRGLYRIKLPIIPEQTALAATLDVWHRRLAHMPREMIHKMIESKVVTGLSVASKDPDRCEDCVLNKCRRVSHQTRTTNTAAKSGQILHADVIGPISPIGLAGQRFVLVVKDEFSKFRLVACLKAKSQVPEAMKTMINLTETQTGNFVNVLVSDNGSEFLSERLIMFLQAKGITHRLSAPYVPQQNGVVERENQFLINQARTILNAGGMLKELWPEAVQASTYVSNRIITRNRSKTPYEHWFGRVPDIKNLRIFGQQASVHKPDHTRTKFDQNGVIMCCVGYTDNFQTYRFFDPATKKLVNSCNAIFLEKVGLPTVAQGVDSYLLADIMLQGEPEPSSSEPEIQESGVQEVNQPELVEKRDLNATYSVNAPLQSNMELSLSQNADLEPQAREMGVLQAEAESPQSIMSTPKQEKRVALPSFFVSLNSPNQVTQHSPATTSTQSQAPVATAQRSDRPDQPVLPVTQTRSLRTRAPMNYKQLSKGDWDIHKGDALVACVANEMKAPRTFQEIMSREDRDSWLQAAEREMSSIMQNNVFELVPRPNTNIVGCRWVLSYKLMPDGSVKPKARLVAQGFTQQLGIDYHNTFAPVAQAENVRFLFSLIPKLNLIMKQCDIKTAFLHGELHEEIYMRQPDGHDDQSGRVWRLKKSLYGLKQAPKCWNDKFSQVLADLGLTQSSNDNCIYYRFQPFIVIAVYVDDCLLLSQSLEAINKIIGGLAEHFELHLIETKKFLGFQYEFIGNGIFIHQEDYLKEKLIEHKFYDVNPAPTPFAQGQKTGSEELFEDPGKFSSIVGALQYAAAQTRPDISFTIGWLGRRLLKPTEGDWQILKRCLRYIRGTLDLGIFYTKTYDERLLAFCDSDYMGDKLRAKATTGTFILHSGGPVAWKSKETFIVCLGIEDTEIECASNIPQAPLQYLPITFSRF